LLIGSSAQVTPEESKQVFSKMKWKKTATAESLAEWTGLPVPTVQAALRQLCSAGRVMFDLEIGRYRLRELTRDPLPVDQLRYANPREEKAKKLVQQGHVSLSRKEASASGVTLYGSVRTSNRSVEPQVVLDHDGRIEQGECTCYFYKQNKLMQGPCEHMMALVAIARD
jgi:hypothetical protein